MPPEDAGMRSSCGPNAARRSMWTGSIVMQPAGRSGAAADYTLSMSTASNGRKRGAGILAQAAATPAHDNAEPHPSLAPAAAGAVVAALTQALGGGAVLTDPATLQSMARDFLRFSRAAHAATPPPLPPLAVARPHSGEDVGKVLAV